MDVSHAASQLLAQEGFLKTLPIDVIEILRSGNNAQYLDTLARLALQPSNTSTIFSIHHALSVEMCSRWLQYTTTESKAAEVFGALARILPVAPYLSPYVSTLLKRERLLASLFAGDF